MELLQDGVAQARQVQDRDMAIVQAEQIAGRRAHALSAPVMYSFVAEGFQIGRNWGTEVAHKKTPGRSQVFLHPLGGPGEARAGGAHEHYQVVYPFTETIDRVVVEAAPSSESRWSVALQCRVSPVATGLTGRPAQG